MGRGWGGPKTNQGDLVKAAVVNERKLTKR